MSSPQSKPLRSFEEIRQEYKETTAVLGDRYYRRMLLDVEIQNVAATQTYQKKCLDLEIETIKNKIDSLVRENEEALKRAPQKPELTSVETTDPSESEHA